MTIRNVFGRRKMRKQIKEMCLNDISPKNYYSRDAPTRLSYATFSKTYAKKTYSEINNRENQKTRVSESNHKAPAPSSISRSSTSTDNTTPTATSTTQRRRKKNPKLKEK